MYYIEENDKLKFLNKMFNIIKIEDDRIVLPINNIENLKEKQSVHLANKTNKKIQEMLSKKIVLSKKVKQNETYVNELYSYGYHIVDGKWLFEAISNKILDYIIENKKIKKEETSIAVLVNDLTDYTLENIKKISTEYKSLNIITNHIEKYKKIEEKIYEKQGLAIVVTNNKKKSLAKSKIILNIDFPKELINKYNIYEEAIIININGNMKINKKRFNGLIINDYEINTRSLCKESKYYKKDLYEAEFYNNIPYRELQNKIKDDKVQIEALFGLNGKIL